MRLCLVTSNLPPVRCGVGDYTFRLARELATKGHDVTVLGSKGPAGPERAGGASIRREIPSWGARGVATLVREVQRLAPDLVLFQWVPFLYSYRGTNPYVPAGIATLRAKGIRLQVMVHEAWVPLTRPSYLVTGPIQRAALGAIVAACQSTAVSIPAWRDMLRRRMPWKRERIAWVPAGGTIDVSPETADERRARRSRVGATDSSILAAAFSLYGSLKGYSALAAAWERIGRERPDSRFVVIGASPEELAARLPRLAGDARVIPTGYLPSEEVSRWIAACDLFFAPYEDGISSRRTSALSAMAHGVPVLSTKGRFTEVELFERSPIVLAPAEDPAAFAAEASALAADPVRREDIGKETRAFHDRSFAWSTIADRLLALDREAGTTRRIGKG